MVNPPVQPLAAIDPLFVIANVVEAGLWLVVALVVGIRWRNLPAVGLLVAFGLSDLVETRTGAWWRPWWLLTWKAICVIGLLTVIVVAWRNRNGRRPEEAGTPAGGGGPGDSKRASAEEEETDARAEEV